VAGGHNPNFSLYEFSNLLSCGLDVTRIFEDYPLWYSGHCQLSTSRGNHADHLSPLAWKGHAQAGSVPLHEAWNAGADRARHIIRQYTQGRIIIDWQDVFSGTDCNIQRPCGATYPGVSLDLDCKDNLIINPKLDKSATSKVEEFLSHLPRADINDILTECNTESAWQDDDEPDLDWFPLTDCDRPKSKPAVKPILKTIVPVDPLAKKQMHLLLVDGHWVHNVTNIWQRFNTLLGQKQSKDCQHRVRDFTVPTIATHLKALSNEAFKAGHCFATLLRCSNNAFLAVVQTTHLTRAGEVAYAVPCVEITTAGAGIELRGQVLAFQPLKGNQESSWHWTGEVARLNPLKSNTKARDILVISVPGVLALPLEIPEANEVAWVILQANFDILCSRVWNQIQQGPVNKLAVCSSSSSFPY
jgi:hypothetical protein